MSDIFREIDEDVRRERYLKLWRRFGIYVIAVAVLLAVGVAGVAGWRQYRERAIQLQSGTFATALALARDGKHREAAQAFDQLAADADGGYVVLSRLQQAAALAASGDRDGAVAIYDALVADGSTPGRFRDLAALLAALHLMDTADAADLDRRLEPLTGAESPWRYTARELAALVRLKAGDRPAARGAFAALADDADAPNGVRGRAAEMLAALPEEK